MPSFSLGTVMVIACLEIFKATGSSGFKKGETNISLVPFCIHYEHTDACPKGHSSSVHVSDAQKLLRLVFSQMHRKLSCLTLSHAEETLGVQSTAVLQCSKHGITVL